MARATLKLRSRDVEEPVPVPAQPARKPAAKVAEEKAEEGTAKVQSSRRDPRAGEGTAKPAPRRDRAGTRQIGGHFAFETWQQLRNLGTRLQLPNQRLWEEALNDLFAKHERAPAKNSSSPRAPAALRTKLMGGHFAVATWAKLRDLGTTLGRTNQQLLEEALEDIFAKYKSQF